MRRITKAVITRGTVRPVVSLLFIVVVGLSVLVELLVEISLAAVGNSLRAVEILLVVLLVAVILLFSECDAA